MNDTTRRWLSIDGVLTLLLAVNWIWFLFLLVTVTWPYLLPGEPQGFPADSANTSGQASGLSQFQVAPKGEPERANDNPMLFLLVLCLMLGSVLVTLADLARRRGRPVLVLLSLGGCAVAGLAFIAVQLYRFSEPAFMPAGGFQALLLLDSAATVSLNLLAGLGLLILSAVLMLVRRSGEVPSLGEQLAAWQWHALDTFWLVLVALAWHWGVMEAL